MGEGEKQVWPVGQDDEVAKLTISDFREVLEISIDDGMIMEDMQ